MLIFGIAACILTPGEVDDLRRRVRDLDQDGSEATQYGGLDCDDARPDVGPHASELCDAVDNDCDGEVDEGWFIDGDHDGFISVNDVGICGLGVEADELPGLDCDDLDSSVFPGAELLCLPDADVDCSGVVDVEQDEDGDGFLACDQTECDDQDPGLPATVYLDADADGFGDPAHAGDKPTCDVPPGYADNAEDCDDADPDLNPQTRWYLDADADGYGVSDDIQLSCVPLAGRSRYPGDCNDADDAYHPGAPESCIEPEDFNCDGSTGYSDADADGWAACEDCDDADPNVSPGATEHCNEVDDDCDGGAIPCCRIGPLESSKARVVRSISRRGLVEGAKA